MTEHKKLGTDGGRIGRWGEVHLGGDEIVAIVTERD